MIRGRFPTLKILVADLSLSFAVLCHSAFPERRVLTPQMVARPQEATYEELRRVHTDRYLQSLNSSATVAGIIEVSLAAFIPAATIDAYVLRPMR